MDSLLYLLKVNVAVILFYGFYRLFFRQDTFFRWKRVALLAIIFISFSYPFADVFKKFFFTTRIENGILPVYALPEVEISGQTVAGQTVSFVQLLPQLLFILYGAMVVTFLCRLLIQTGIILRMVTGAQKKELYGQTIHHRSDIKTPFSFFRWIVLNPALYTDTELREILRHEETHVREAHSIDILLAELFCTFCWFNPFAWLLKREIRMNLEFLADRSVLASGYEAEHYQFHLLRLTYHKAAAKITNNFNVSLLKKRIFMMNKKQTSKLSIFKYTLLIPVIGALVLFNNAFKLKAGTVATDLLVEMNEMIIETTTSVVQEPTVQPKLKPGSFSSNGRIIQIEQVDPQQQPYSKDDKQIYTHVEVMPGFPGGEEAMMNWLMENIDYPQSALDRGISGKVIVRFVVEPDGKISNPEVVRPIDPACDEEALRVINKMPKWLPGKQNGEHVFVYFMLPITFKIINDDATEKQAPSDDAKANVSIWFKPNDTTSKGFIGNVNIELDGKEISRSELDKIDIDNIESYTLLEGENGHKLIITLKK